MGSHTSSLQVFDTLPLGATVVRKEPFKNTFAVKVSDKEVVCLDSSNLCTCVHISRFLSSRLDSIDVEKTKHINKAMMNKGASLDVSRQRAEDARKRQVRMSSEESFVLHCHYRRSFGNHRTHNPFLIKDKEGSWTVFNFPPKEE
jgi:hypothetical protein